MWCECESDESVVAMRCREPETREQNRQLSVFQRLVASRPLVSIDRVSFSIFRSVSQRSNSLKNLEKPNFDEARDPCRDVGDETREESSADSVRGEKARDERQKAKKGRRRSEASDSARPAGRGRGSSSPLCRGARARSRLRGTAVAVSRRPAVAAGVL